MSPRSLPQQPPTPGGSKATPKPGLLRRLAAVIYDFLLLAAVLFFATALLLPFNHGRAFTSEQAFFPFYLLLVSFLFYGWFWTHGGQTLGLKAWKIAVLDYEQNPISWRQAALRFIGAILSWAPLGFGFWWMLFDKNQKTWHDYLSGTDVFFAPRRPSSNHANPKSTP